MVSTKCAPPPPLKGGGTQILKISKRGEPEKKFGVGETKKVARRPGSSSPIEKQENKDY